ncbi:MAG: putative integral membrane protein [Sulfurimonas sp.]|jgi:uncharacterized integral membrane protein
MLKLKLYTALSLIVLVIIIVLQNTQLVETKVLFATIIMSRAALLGITMFIGMVVGFLIALNITNHLPKKD